MVTMTTYNDYKPIKRLNSIMADITATMKPAFRLLRTIKDKGMAEPSVFYIDGMVSFEWVRDNNYVVTVEFEPDGNISLFSMRMEKDPVSEDTRDYHHMEKFVLDRIRSFPVSDES
jgi:hypothetical protein